MQKSVIPNSNTKRSNTILTSFRDEEMVCEEPEEATQQLIRIARKPQIMRTVYETQILMNSLRKIKFFRDQFESYYEDMLEDVCEHAKLQMMLDKEIVIHQDTTGDTFYIIIKGTVKVVRKVSTQIGQVVNKRGHLKDNYVEQTKVLAILQNGDAFGELSLLENKPRAATVYCDSDSYFLVLDKVAFDRIISTKAKRQFIHLLEKLRDNSILKELSINSVKVLFLTMERISFCYGDYLYKYHEQSDAIYFIAEGEFKLQQEVHEPDEGTKEMMSQRQKKQMFDVKIAGINECVGLEDFISETLHTQQAVCSSQEGIVFKLDRNDYKRLEQRYPDICQIMVSVAQEKTFYYSNLSQQVCDTKKSVQETKVVAVNNSSYSTSTKNLRKIITEDHQMSFISRDHITLNEDNDIMMKFSPFFQIESHTQPFQVNSIDSIHKQRVQSAGYRTLPQYQAPIEIQNYSSQRAQSATIPLIKNTPDRIITLNEVRQQTVSSTTNRRKKYKTMTVSKLDAMQQKIQVYLRLTQEEIQNISKNTRARQLSYKESKPYIRVYQDKNVLQFLDNMKTNPVNEVNYDQNAMKIQANVNSSYIKLRPQSGKQPQLYHNVCPISQTMRVQPKSFDYSNWMGNASKLDTIHNYSSSRGFKKFSNNLVNSMEVVQIPLKYHSALIKVNSQNSFGFTKYKMGQSRKGLLMKSFMHK